MEICSSNHEEVCYEGGWKKVCPVCDKMELNAILEQEKLGLEEYIERLEEELAKAICELQRGKGC